MSVWLIALDQTILAPALPIIASQFKALDQLAWIASACELSALASAANSDPVSPGSIYEN